MPPKATGSDEDGWAGSTPLTGTSPGVPERNARACRWIESCPPSLFDGYGACEVNVNRCRFVANLRLSFLINVYKDRFRRLDLQIRGVKCTRDTSSACLSSRQSTFASAVCSRLVLVGHDQHQVSCSVMISTRFLAPPLLRVMISTRFLAPS